MVIASVRKSVPRNMLIYHPRKLFGFFVFVEKLRPNNWLFRDRFYYVTMVPSELVGEQMQKNCKFWKRCWWCCKGNQVTSLTIFVNSALTFCAQLVVPWWGVNPKHTRCRAIGNVYRWIVLEFLISDFVSKIIKFSLKP